MPGKTQGGGYSICSGRWGCAAAKGVFFTLSVYSRVAVFQFQYIQGLVFCQNESRKYTLVEKLGQTRSKKCISVEKIVIFVSFCTN